MILAAARPIIPHMAIIGGRLRSHHFQNWRKRSMSPRCTIKNRILALKWLRPLMLLSGQGLVVLP
jgi:hypothetical protein